MRTFLNVLVSTVLIKWLHTTVVWFCTPWWQSVHIVNKLRILNTSAQALEMIWMLKWTNYSKSNGFHQLLDNWTVRYRHWRWLWCENELIGIYEIWNGFNELLEHWTVLFHCWINELIQILNGFYEHLVHWIIRCRWWRWLWC